MDNIVNCFYEVEDSFHSLNGNSKGMLVVVQSGAGTRFFFGKRSRKSSSTMKLRGCMRNTFS